MAGVSYALAYQVYNSSWSRFNTITTLIPPHSHSRARFRSWDRKHHQLHTVTIPRPYHRSVDMPTPSRLCLKARSPWLRPNTHSQGRKGLISLSSLSETQERSIAGKSAYVSIDQPYTLQRFYITTRSAFLADCRQLG